MRRATAVRFGAAVTAVLTLAGCLDDTASRREAMPAVAVTASAVTIVGPSGFCVDPDGSTSDRDRAFVVLGSCAAIANRPNMPQPDLPVVLTAAVARGRAITPGALEAYYASRQKAQQRAARDGGGFEILDVALDNDVVYLHFRDEATKGDWRGFLGLDPDVTVTLAVRVGPGSRVSKKEQLSALREFARRVAVANSDRVLAARGS